MPTLKEFSDSVYDVTLRFGGMSEPVVVRVRPFENLQARVKELEDIDGETDEGRLKIYGLACARLESWENMREELPPQYESESAIPRFARHLYKPLNGDDAPPYYLDGDPNAKPRELDIPLKPEALLDVKFPFVLLRNLVQRALEEVDTKKQSGSRR